MSQLYQTGTKSPRKPCGPKGVKTGSYRNPADHASCILHPTSPNRFRRETGPQDKPVCKQNPRTGAFFHLSQSSLKPHQPRCLGLDVIFVTMARLSSTYVSRAWVAIISGLYSSMLVGHPDMSEVRMLIAPRRCAPELPRESLTRPDFPYSRMFCRHVWAAPLKFLLPHFPAHLLFGSG